MAALAGLPYVALKFRKDGARTTTGPIFPAGVTDLIVISHGWHQDPDDAQAMYTAMLTHLQQQAAAAGRLAGRKFGVTGIYWPSDQFKDDLSQETHAVLEGPAAAAAGAHDGDLVKLQKRARELAPVLGVSADRLETLATLAVTGASGDKDALLKALRKAMTAGDAPDPELADEHAELLSASTSGQQVIQALQAAGARGVAAAAAGGAQAAALGLSGGASPAVGLFSGPIAAVATLLNQAAYFNLKKRAGKIGASLGRLIDLEGVPAGVRLHMIGHSFGARLVTSATATMAARPHSLTLLQGAFSHNGLGVNVKPGLDGAFRSVVAQNKVTGRIAISHTWNDHAVGVAYAIASRASNEIAAGLIRVTDTFGGAKDIHGGIGANGALRLKPGEGSAQVLTGAAIPALNPGVNNLKCDFIKGHNDIRTAEVGRLLVAAVE
ncbi:hypothetical protein [Phenylobacterium kunshanense]|uniref:Alpha/beta hydrolase n=1 Tax=Phenylobacterium kunshanense TaxID=1445034 RepID=A0A328BA50_9CAUL|nr:hypothetical protein [Phenylobacterium kunshanense]RAK63669.1 hypothetical protein DJ019_15545 [Phenylobacterium kunshanense]